MCVLCVLVTGIEHENTRKIKEGQEKKYFTNGRTIQCRARGRHWIRLTERSTETETQQVGLIEREGESVYRVRASERRWQ